MIFLFLNMSLKFSESVWYRDSQCVVQIISSVSITWEAAGNANSQAAVQF